MILSEDLESHTVNRRVMNRMIGFARLAAVVVLLICLMVGLGYAFNKSILVRLYPGFQATSVTTAVSLGLLAIAVALRSVDLLKLTRVISFGVLAIVASVFASYVIFHDDLVSDALVSMIFGSLSKVEGKTSIATGLGLAFVTVALLFGTSERRASRNLSDAFAALGLIVSGLALIGYAYGVQDLYATMIFRKIGLLSAIGLFLLSLSVVLVKPDGGWASLIVSDLAGGAPTRRQLLLTLFLPFVGWLLIKITHTEAIGPNLAMAVLVLLTVISLSALILRDGHIQNELDAIQRLQTRQLASARSDLEAELKHRSIALDREIRDRIQAEDALRQSQKMDALGQLTGGIAHDFNNMLGIVIGSLGLVRNRLSGAEDRLIPKFIDNAYEAAQRAALLTSRLLAFSRRQPLNPRVLDLPRLVGGMSELLRSTIGESIAVEVFAAGRWPVFVDPVQLESALLNLAVNARDAMTKGGTLRIETADVEVDESEALTQKEIAAGQYAMISITDTGEGMSPEVLERAFEPFYTTKGAGKGTGLGLSQVFGFVKQSGGSIKVVSTLGRGTTFTLYLPRFLSDDSEVSAVSERSDTPLGKAEELILVVEDEPKVRHMSVDALRELGYTVISASTPAEALSQLEMQQGLTLLFTDIVMPDMNGRELAHLAVKRQPDLKVLFTSGYEWNATVPTGINDPGASLLPKPFTIDQLARKIRDTIDSTKAINA